MSVYDDQDFEEQQQRIQQLEKENRELRRKLPPETAPPPEWVQEMDEIPTDLPEREYEERIMQTVDKFGGNTSWNSQ